MNVEVLMFGALAERAAKRDTFDLPDLASAYDIVAAVRERYPDASGVLEKCCVAVNQEIVSSDHAIASGDEIALLPPMSGGSIHVLLTDEPSVERAVTSTASRGAGGTVSFIGTVRDSCDKGRVDSLEYSAYEPMATKVMQHIADEAVAKWELHGIAIEHAVGDRSAGAITFVVVCSAAHRDEAFDACRYVVDEVKHRVPVWKREIGPWGQRWIGA